MLQVHAAGGGGLKRVGVASGDALPPGLAWVDLMEPTQEEEAAVESALGIEVPTREEMQEIETSSRLRQEDGSLYMTASVLTGADTEHPEGAAVTFILAGGRLVTLRYADPHPFRVFAAHAERHPDACASGEAALAGLMGAIVDRAADILERVGADVEGLSWRVFHDSGERGGLQGRSLREVLRRIGHAGDLTSKARESLVSLDRLLRFFAEVRSDAAPRDIRAHLETLSHDVLSLSNHATFLADKVNFLLSATLGMINIEQNNIIKLFSVAAVVLLPPTLIASIYGMNFQFMPELGSPLGYPLALLTMVLSAVLPYLYFKRRGWL